MIVWGEFLFDVDITEFEEEWEGPSEAVGREFGVGGRVSRGVTGAEQNSEGLGQGIRGQGSQVRQRLMGSQVPVNHCGCVFGDGSVERGDKLGRWEEVSRQDIHGV